MVIELLRGDELGLYTVRRGPVIEIGEEGLSASQESWEHITNVYDHGVHNSEHLLEVGLEIVVGDVDGFGYLQDANDGEVGVVVCDCRCSLVERKSYVGIEFVRP